MKRIFGDLLMSPREDALICRTSTGEPAGFVTLSLRAEYVPGASASPIGYIEGIFVEKKYRKMRPGKRLVKELEKWALRRGVRELASDALV